MEKEFKCKLSFLEKTTKIFNNHIKNLENYVYNLANNSSFVESLYNTIHD